MDYKEKILAELIETLANAQISKGAQSFVAGCMKAYLASLPTDKEITKGLWDKYIYDVEHRGYSYDFGTWMSLYWLKERK